MIVAQDINTPGTSAQAEYRITGGPFRLKAVSFFWTDAGAAVVKVGSIVLTDLQNNVLFRGAVPQTVAADNVFATIGVGLSDGVSRAAVMTASVATGPIPDLWIDRDCIMTIQILDAEALTFITRAVVFFEKHDAS